MVTTKETPRFHHLPDHETQRIEAGTTLRKALAILRDIDFGNIGGMHWLELSDGTTLEVVNRPTSDGGELMSSQRVRRFKFEDGREKTIRYYDL